MTDRYAGGSTTSRFTQMLPDSAQPTAQETWATREGRHPITGNGSPLLQAALSYARDGCPIFPCNEQTKQSLTVHGFADASTDQMTILAWWQRWPNAMIGIPTGEASGVWVLDIDDPALFEGACPLGLPTTRKVQTGKGYHLYWRFDAAAPVRNAQRHPKRGWPFATMPGAEVRGAGGYVIAPPSRHPSGKLYTFANDDAPAEAPSSLLAIVAGTAAQEAPEPRSALSQGQAGVNTAYGLAALEGECSAIRAAANGEQENALNEGALRIGAVCAGGELSFDTARASLIAVALGMASHNSRNPWTPELIAKKVERGLQDGAAKPRSARNGIELLRSEMGGSAAPDYRERPPSDWPDPVPLSDELPPVTALDPRLLPSQLSGFVQDVAERMNCPTDLVAIPAMVAAGASIGRKVGIRPQRRTDWLEVGNLWGCVVAPAGSLKSPAAAEALSPIRRLEAKAAEENATALADFKAAESVYKLERASAEQAAKAALKSKGRENAVDLLRAVPEPVAPPLKRHLTSDGTAEKLGEICADNSNGIMVHRDELVSLLADLDNPDKASARGFYLTGWSGMEGYTYDRIMRGTVRIEAVNLSVCGTTQPHRLARYIRDSLRGFDDGMVQRLQLLAWPDFSGSFREVDRYPDSSARLAANECFADLASLDVREIGARWEESTGPYGVPFLRFADDAQEAFSEWRGGLEHRLTSDEFSPCLKSHLAKYRGLIPRLAMICHLANNDFGPVSSMAIGQALGWAAYLESHARRAYASVSLDNAEAARAIWRRMRKGDLPGTFTARDIQRKGWTGLNNKERVAVGLAALLEADWLGSDEVQTGGRPMTVYTANPKALKIRNAYQGN